LAVSVWRFGESLWRVGFLPVHGVILSV
jgi:hypothetical protein